MASGLYFLSKLHNQSLVPKSQKVLFYNIDQIELDCLKKQRSDKINPAEKNIFAHTAHTKWHNRNDIPNRI